MKYVECVFSERVPDLKLLTISYSLFQFAIALFVQSISLFLAETFSYDTGDIGLFFTVMCMGLALNILFIQPILSRYIRINKLIMSSIVIIAFMLLIQGTLVYMDDFVRLNVRPAIWISSLILYIFMPFANTGYTAIYSDYANDNEQGRAMGGPGQLSSLMSFISSLFIGYFVLAHESIILILAGVLALLATLLLSKQFLEK